jgi:hypothetical protein
MATMATSPRRATHGDAAERRVIDRVQTGVRIERRILQVLKAFASSKGLSVGDLLEGIILHAFDGVAPFGAESRKTIEALKQVYGLDLEAKDSHLLVERGPRARQK